MHEKETERASEVQRQTEYDCEPKETRTEWTVLNTVSLNMIRLVRVKLRQYVLSIPRQFFFVKKCGEELEDLLGE